MAPTFCRNGLLSISIVLWWAASTILAAPSTPASIELLYPRATNTTTSSNSTTPSNTTTSSSPASDPQDSTAFPSHGGALAGAIIGLLGVVILFVAVFTFVMRHRAVVRRNTRNRYHLVPAVRAQQMNLYARDQESRLKAGRSRSAGGSSSAGRSLGGSYGGTRPSVVTAPPRAARGWKRPFSMEDPPPSYYDDRPPPRA